MLYIFWETEVCSFQDWQIASKKLNEKSKFKFFSVDAWVILLPDKILSKNFMNGFFDKKCPKMLTLGIFIILVNIGISMRLVRKLGDTRIR